MASSIQLDLCDRFEFRGNVEWMGIAAEKRGPIQEIQTAELKPGEGIEGEHHSKTRVSKRQVTLIQFEHLDVIASLLGRTCVRPEALRRNFAVSGINLASLRRRKFRIGDVVLQGTGDCVPCQRMEQTLGAGGYEAMVSHGGITAIVEAAGSVRVGDAVTVNV